MAGGPRWKPVGIGTALGVVALLFATTAPVAATEPPLGQLVLSNPLPGFTVMPPGPDNGPIAPSRLEALTTDPQALQELSDGTITGYLREWTGLQAGGALVIAAFRVQDAQGAAAFLDGEDNSLSHKSGVRAVTVSGVPDADGFIGTSPFDQYAITFARGDVAFSIEYVSTHGDLMLPEINKVAADQAAAVGGDPVRPGMPTNGAYVLGEISAPVVIVGIPVWLLVRRGRRNEKRKRAQFAGDMPFAVSMPYQPSVPAGMPAMRTPGWYQSGDSASGYWDGYAWTAWKRWNGTSWVDVPR